MDRYQIRRNDNNQYYFTRNTMGLDGEKEVSIRLNNPCERNYYAISKEHAGNLMNSEIDVYWDDETEMFYLYSNDDLQDLLTFDEMKER